MRAVTLISLITSQVSPVTVSLVLNTAALMADHHPLTHVRLVGDHAAFADLRSGEHDRPRAHRRAHVGAEADGGAGRLQQHVERQFAPRLAPPLSQDEEEDERTVDEDREPHHGEGRPRGVGERADHVVEAEPRAEAAARRMSRGRPLVDILSNEHAISGMGIYLCHLPSGPEACEAPPYEKYAAGALRF
mgnify:CR=1 FL=1